LHRKNSALKDGQLRASAVCRNHEVALWYSTHTNLYKHLVQGGLSLKSGTAIPRQRDSDFIPLNEIMMCNSVGGWVSGGRRGSRKEAVTGSFIL